MALLAERYGAQESLCRSERQRLFQISQFPAHQIVDKQQLAPPEQRWVLPRGGTPTKRGVETQLGSDPLAARLPVRSQEVPQPGVGLSTRVTLGHLTTEPGPALALVCVKHLLGQGHVSHSAPFFAVLKQFWQSLLKRGKDELSTDYCRRSNYLFRWFLPLNHNFLQLGRPISDLLG